MNKRLYITDLDGTFLPDNKAVPKKTNEMIESIRSNGNYFTVATSRSLEVCMRMLAGVDLDAPIICNNGVFVADLRTGTRLSCEYLPHETGAIVLEEGMKLAITPFVFLFTNKENIIFQDTKNKEKERFYKERMKDPRMKKIDSIVDCINDGEIITINYMGNHDTLSILKSNLIQREINANILYYKNQESADAYYLEITNAHATKKYALKDLVNRLGVDIKDVIAFGNDMNDLGMLEIAGTSCAVRNSAQHIIDICDVVIDSNNDYGVISYINAIEKNY